MVGQLRHELPKRPRFLDKTSSRFLLENYGHLPKGLETLLPCLCAPHKSRGIQIPASDMNRESSQSGEENTDVRRRPEGRKKRFRFAIDNG